MEAKKMNLRHRKSYLAEKKKSWLQKFKEKHGIESKGTGGKVIGYSDKEKKWYGWSHRARVGFKVGDRIFQANYGDDHTPFTKHGKKPIKTLADAKKAAERFAKYVS